MTTRAGIADAKGTCSGRSESASVDQSVFHMRHELVNAQVEVLRLFLEKKPRDELLEAVGRLAECAALSFREEEALMGSIADPAHGERHREVLVQIECLRSDVLDFDRGHLLARLIQVDRCLTAHISDAVRDLDVQGPDRSAEREATIG